VLLPLALISQDFISAGISFLILVAFGIVTGWLMRRSEREVALFLQDRAVGGRSQALMLVLAAPITQVVHLIALVRAYTRTDVTWRGIRYQIRSGTDLTRDAYAPFVLEDQSFTTTEHSL